MSLNHSPAIVTDGLVLCLDAANIRSYPKSGTTWSDLVGTNNGTLTNMDAANFSSDNGGSLSFDGSDEYCLVPYEATSNISGFCWVKFDNFSGATVIKNWGANLRGAFHFDASTVGAGYLGLYIFSGSQISISDSFLMSTNVWYNVGFTISNSSYSIYRDGKIATSASHSGLSILNRPNLGVGCKLNNDGTSPDITNPNYLNGNIATTQIYNRALTGDEVRQNYEATVGRYT